MKNNYLIKKWNNPREGLFRALSTAVSMVLLMMSATVSFGQSPCATPIDFTVQSIDQSAEGVNDGKMIISGVPDSVLVGFELSSATPYSGTLTNPANAFSNLTTATETNTIGGYLSQTLANPADENGTNYVVRAQYPNGCYTDVVYNHPRVNWSETPDYTDLAVSITSSPSYAVEPGETVTINIAVTNVDTNTNVNTVTATGVQITVYDAVSGLTYTSTVSGDGTFDDPSNIWTVGDILPGETKSITLEYTLTDRGIYQIQAEVSTVTNTEDEYDSTPAEDAILMNEDDEGSVCISAPWDWCDTDSYSFEFSGLDANIITWQYSTDGGSNWTDIPGGTTVPNIGSVPLSKDSLIILGPAMFSYYYTDGATDDCQPDEPCCPIEIVPGVIPDLPDLTPEAICYGEPFPSKQAVDGTPLTDYDIDRGDVQYQWYQWDGSDPSSMVAIAGDTTVFDWTGLADTAGTYYYKIVGWDDLHETCRDSADFTFQVLDIEKPVASSNSPLCERDQLELTVANLSEYPNPTDYTFNWWHAPDSSRAQTGDSVGVASVVYNADSGMYVVQVSQTFTTISSPVYCEKKDTVDVIVYPLPDAPTVVDAEYCQFDTVDPVVNQVTDSTTNSYPYAVTNLVWYYQDTTGAPRYTGDPALDNFIDNTQPDTYGPFIVQNEDVNGCISDTVSFNININGLPEPPTVADLAYCEFTDPVPALTAGKTTENDDYGLIWWIGTDTTTVPGDPGAAPTPSTALIDTLTYYVSQVDSTLSTNCVSFTAQIDVYIRDVPEAPTMVNPEYCQDETATPLDDVAWFTPSVLSTTSPSDQDTLWTFDGVVDVTTAPTPTTTEAGSEYGIVSQVWSYDHPDGVSSPTVCPGPVEDFIVIVNPTPVFSLVAVNGLCDGLTPLNNGELYISDYRDSDTIRYTVGPTFDINNQAEPQQTGFNVDTNDGVFASGLTNPTVGSSATTYAVQVETEFGCTFEDTVDLAPKDCDCPGGYCEPASVSKIL
ncbi:DUF11 domain-containing protein [Jiulongibacter sediminis]|uniref:DUF11 domain-containing protein n=1 Tax=Jiulongibacter sediminis TaxID=1605367 RepID=A0A0P7C724_9BACT|nr:DUF11 domain-containing protein [Jiulongibacter sediminis]KPM49250.1 hypothetical protein AFM12_01060 [Jiulongibacter sediminis]TBX26305.1 hypothetical protein TK44_01060 [Jiulongibacter sediminis]